MGLFSEKVILETKNVLRGLKGRVQVTYFGKEEECELCTSVNAFVDELVAIEPRLEVEKKDLIKDAGLAAALGIHHVPALAIHHPDGGRPAFRYYGIPGGYEFGAFLKVLELYSSAEPSGDVGAKVETEKEVNLKVFVLTTCPSCPTMAYLAAGFAHANPMITAEIIEANTFTDLAARFTVGSVPKTVINDTRELTGVVGAQELAGEIKAS